MFLWQLWLIVGIIVLIIDFFTATMLLVNIALAFLFTSVVAYFGGNLYIQLITLGVSSAILLAFLYPFLKSKLQQTKYDDFESKYIGTSAKVVSTVTKKGGRITVFGEEWNAVSNNETSIEIGETVKIIAQKGLTMMVEKI